MQASWKKKKARVGRLTQAVVGVNNFARARIVWPLQLLKRRKKRRKVNGREKKSKKNRGISDRCRVFTARLVRSHQVSFTDDDLIFVRRAHVCVARILKIRKISPTRRKRLTMHQLFFLALYCTFALTHVHRDTTDHTPRNWNKKKRKKKAGKQVSDYDGARPLTDWPGRATSARLYAVAPRLGMRCD